MVRIRQLNKSYLVGDQPLHVLKDLSLDVEDGELVSVMGASGSGKSTLLNVLGILDSYDSGSYELGGTLVRDLTEAEAARYRNQFVGFIFQSFHLLPFKTAEENVALPLLYAGVPRGERIRRARELLEQVGLGAWSQRRPNQLSGGQKQRVAIARALVGRPRIVLADEPTGALDSTTSQEIMQLLIEVNQEAQATVIVVTHDADVAEQTQRVIRLRDGRIDS